MKKRIINTFAAIVGQENIRYSQAQLHAYSYDATANFQSKPDLVVAPASTEEIAEIVKLCAKKQIPIVSRGSGTNLAAGTVPTNGGVVILFHRMNEILELDQENLTMTVQPGVITQDISVHAEQHGLFYPPDPSSMKISTIGGNVSENSGGLRGLKYGVTKDYVKALTVVLADGSILKTGGKLAKDVAGYDLTSLLVGSEGTLGIITEITLKLIPLPVYKKTGIAYFNSLEDAAKTVSSIIAHKIIPVTLEFMDRGTIGAIEDFMKMGLPRDAEAMLLLEQDGDEELVERDIQKMIDIAVAKGATSTSIAASSEEADVLKAGRRSALSALARKRPTTILEDATVPRSEIAKMVRAIQEIAQKYNVQISTFGHAGDGNLHPTCLTDIRNKEEMERVEKALEEIFEAAIQLGGTITGEHGVGEMKAPYLEWKIGESGIQVMKLIKQSLDPQNIMNPGKVFAKASKKRLVVHNE
ncbi:FAD-binding protein [Jeotgalibacillus sp. S-D1]|uniref:FAD-binding oxidoreductase n=1 Tax=Jeotgalibacillus sp. S-D1 TaxID=2552189 RepID=UPI00105A1FC7|nr:FAD-linked oxidase C-terminal domain-containing protein [Jeotgalibacillus sp. S-D1]TDL32647.1 FAD-binding protein [Jeotgalibacillus sp. S-D1]